MKSIVNDVKRYLNTKPYLIAVLMTALLGYGFKICHTTIGIDDTPFEYYFSDGLIVVVGRWVLYLINKIASIGTFAPFFTELLGVMLLVVAVTLWSILLERIFEDSIPKWGYIVFACIFISNPLISEVYTYFLHNGISIGYLFSGLSLLFFMQGMDQRGRKGIVSYLMSAVCIWAALGCYESFAVVYLVGLFLILLSRRMKGHRDKVVLSTVVGAAVMVTALFLRSIMGHILIGMFHLEQLQGEAVNRGIVEMLGWVTEENGIAELIMALKRCYVMYGVFGFVYLPITVYIIAVLTFVILLVVYTIRKRDLWIGLLGIAVLVSSWCLIFVEGKVTLYRACQFLPLFSAYAVLLLFHVIRKHKWACGKVVTGIVIAVSGVLVLNQASDLNHWFYIDYMKYEAAKSTMLEIAVDLERDYDTSKPLIFTGEYEIPMSIIGDAYVPIGSEEFYRIQSLTLPMDEHLLEKFYRRNCVWVAQTPSLSVIQWGMSAFDTDEELVRFMNMHGYSFVAETDKNKIDKVAADTIDYPEWPKSGSIVEFEDCIVIHF